MPKGGLGFSGGVMKKLMHGLLVISFLFLTGSVFAEHYVNGVEGIKGGSVPPPGTYLRLYNAYYTADKMMDPSGSEADIGFDVEVMAVVPRLIWVSQKTVLGGNYAAGPEVSVFIPKAMLFASLRALWEFEAEDRSEGQMAVLTLTKIF